MKEPTRSEGDLNLLGDELDRLFAVQDKTLSEKKRKILVSELMDTEIPIGAILNGIKSLLDADLKSIKLGTLIMASRQYVASEPEMGARCTDCVDGFVLMKDDQKRTSALGCQCARGRARAKGSRLVVWDGQEDQFSKRGLLSRR